MEKERISEAALLKRTGKRWNEWFHILDKAGGQKKSHKEMAAYLHGTHLPDDPWYSQTIVVAYEQERGLRVTHQRIGGFEVSVSKTIGLPVRELWSWVENSEKRNRWLQNKEMIVHRATPHRTMRVTWIDGRKSVNIAFYRKGENKCQITVQHAKLSDPEEAAARKSYWKDALEALKRLSERA